MTWQNTFKAINGSTVKITGLSAEMAKRLGVKDGDEGTYTKPPTIFGAPTIKIEGRLSGSITVQMLEEAGATIVLIAPPPESELAAAHPARPLDMGSIEGIEQPIQHIG